VRRQHGERGANLVGILIAAEELADLSASHAVTASVAQRTQDIVGHRVAAGCAKSGTARRPRTTVASES
jgi:hypothetical protein